MPLYRVPIRQVRDEGTTLATAYAIDFVGAGVSVASSGGIATATISGGGVAAITFSAYEFDAGVNPVNAGTFDITGLSGLTAAKPVLISQAAGPYTGKGDATAADEPEMDQISLTAYTLSTTSIRVYWEAEYGFICGNIKVFYLAGS
jgi:hypothetical protein